MIKNPGVVTTENSDRVGQKFLFVPMRTKNPSVGTEALENFVVVNFGKLPPSRKKKCTMDEEIRTLTDGFKSLAAALTVAPLTDPLIGIKKFDPSKDPAFARIKEFQEACALFDWQDSTELQRFCFYLALNATKQ